MTIFASMTSSDVDVCFDDFGELVTYIPVDTGIPIRVKAIIDYDVQPFPGVSFSSVSIPQTQIDIRYQDLSNPKRGDVIKTTNDNFIVDDVIPGSNDRLIVKVAVKNG